MLFAERALAFVRMTLWRDGRLLAPYEDGRAHLNAYLDDYALIVDAALELLQTRWRRDDIDFAVELAGVLLARSRDPANGGCFSTSSEHEALIQRPKPLADESMSASNGVVAMALLRAGHLFGEPRYLDAATGMLKLAAGPIRRMLTRIRRCSPYCMSISIPPTPSSSAAARLIPPTTRCVGSGPPRRPSTSCALLDPPTSPR